MGEIMGPPRHVESRPACDAGSGVDTGRWRSASQGRRWPAWVLRQCIGRSGIPGTGAALAPRGRGDVVPVAPVRIGGLVAVDVVSGVAVVGAGVLGGVVLPAARARPQPGPPACRHGAVLGLLVARGAVHEGL